MKNYTPEQFKEVLDYHVNKSPEYLIVTPQEKPTITMLGGIAGSGKSQLMDFINKENKLFVNGDEYRCLHPNNKELIKDVKNYAGNTGEFSGKFVRALIDAAEKDRKNIIVEGTFRTSENPSNEISNAIKNGYEVEAIKIMVCPAQISWISTLTRNEDLKKTGAGRLVESNYFMTMVGSLAANVKEVVNKFNAPLEIYQRQQDDQAKLIYDSKNPTQKVDIEKLINTELFRELTQKEQIFFDANKHLHLENFPYQKEFLDELGDADLEL